MYLKTMIKIISFLECKYRRRYPNPHSKFASEKMWRRNGRASVQKRSIFKQKNASRNRRWALRQNGRVQRLPESI